MMNWFHVRCDKMFRALQTENERLHSENQQLFRAFEKLAGDYDTLAKKIVDGPPRRIIPHPESARLLLPRAIAAQVDWERMGMAPPEETS